MSEYAEMRGRRTFLLSVGVLAAFVAGLLLLITVMAPTGEAQPHGRGGDGGVWESVTRWAEGAMQHRSSVARSGV